MKHYNTAIDVNVPPEEYIKLLSTIYDKKALVILIVDIFDFPNSIFPEIIEILGTKRPVFLVGNKIDLLPRDSHNYLNHIKDCLNEAAAKFGLAALNIQHTCLISAKTGYGIEEMITELHLKWKSKGDVYLVGCTNVGKSSLFNALLQSDYCKVLARNIVQKATASEWPGTTLRFLKFPILRPSDMRIYMRSQRLQDEQEQRKAEQQLRRDQAQKTGNPKYATLIGHIGTTFEVRNDEVSTDPFSVRSKSTESTQILTLNENHKDYIQSKWCYDTPGVVQKEQIINKLTAEELLLTLPKEMVLPRTFLMKPNMSIFVGGLGRVDYLPKKDDDTSIRVSVYASRHIPILICDLNKAELIYKTFLGTHVLGVPIGNAERLEKWPELNSSDVIPLTGIQDQSALCDFVLSSAGWIAINLPNELNAYFKIWTPAGMGIVVRQPPLLPYGDRMRGDRIRKSLAYKRGKLFV